ncbi:bactofilin family protein [Shewanella salipaludis]|uniref:Polymer-forming cytoskeletal protein n=1 Tax=Shewanella salipaludis TaxID=2723052 RepID=A0A972FRT1_9GAMM|nr:polymer-forming cytoskeletal protein [Shewanella salipaludis]NMH64542.1 polymer-forming cytoskeletal protein [Shewanella salipaludis]
MFKKKKPTAALTFIAQGTKLTGMTEFSGDALIGGELNGSVYSEANITIELNGCIQGEVKCHELKVSGFFNGKLACDKLIITGSGTLEGEISCTSMEIYDGGQFIGTRVKEQLMLLDSAPKAAGVTEGGQDCDFAEAAGA